MRNVLQPYNCLVVKWRVGIMEGCGQRVLTGMFGCEGEEVTGEWTELFIEGRLYCSLGTEVDKRVRECSNMNVGNMYGKRWL